MEHSEGLPIVVRVDLEVIAMKVYYILFSTIALLTNAV